MKLTTSKNDRGLKGRLARLDVPSSRRFSAGFTLVETVVALSVMALGLLAGVALLERGTTMSEDATSMFIGEDRARGALSGMFDVLTESAVQYVDTGMRVHTNGVLGAATDVFSDRFTIPGVTMRQCTSPTCSFHTKADLSTFTKRLNCGFEYCTGIANASVTRGKVLPGTMTSCPFDSSALSTTPRLDGVKFFIPRDSTGEFTALGNGSPKYGGLVFLFPCAAPNGLTELRRYDVYASDLIPSPPMYSAGFSRFSPLDPTMIDLFDFGTDGTVNGVVDGKVPNTIAASDATNETFTTALYQGDPVILVSKTLNSGLFYPQRTLTLRINLSTGETYVYVDHHDTATVYWRASRTFTRMPKTLVGNLTELAISTQASHPYSAGVNPTGVSEPNVVRITVGTSDAPRNSDTQWHHHVESFQLKTRNN